MYPLNMQLAVGTGFAVANSDEERDALLTHGYVSPDDMPEADPAEADNAGHTVQSVRAVLDGAGIAYDKRLGLNKLLALLPQV